MDSSRSTLSQEHALEKIQKNQLPRDVLAFINTRAMKLARGFIRPGASDRRGNMLPDFHTILMTKGWQASMKLRARRPDLAVGGLSSEEQAWLTTAMHRQAIDLSRRSKTRQECISLTVEPGSMENAKIAKATSWDPIPQLEARADLQRLDQEVSSVDMAVITDAIEAGSSKAATPEGVSIRQGQKRVRAARGRAFLVLDGNQRTAPKLTARVLRPRVESTRRGSLRDLQRGATVQSNLRNGATGSGSQGTGYLIASGDFRSQIGSSLWDLGRGHRPSESFTPYAQGFSRRVGSGDGPAVHGSGLRAISTRSSVAFGWGRTGSDYGRSYEKTAQATQEQRSEAHGYGRGRERTGFWVDEVGGYSGDPNTALPTNHSQRPRPAGDARGGESGASCGEAIGSGRGVSGRREWAWIRFEPDDRGSSAGAMARIPPGVHEPNLRSHPPNHVLVPAPQFLGAARRGSLGPPGDAWRD